MSETCLRVGVIGVGNWGRNVLRNFDAAARCEVRWMGDLSEEALNRQAKLYPHILPTKNPAEIFNDAEVDAVVIATSAVTHFELARQALEVGQHVYVEKPLTLSSGEAETLVKLAREKSRKLMVGHLLLYHAYVLELRRMIEAGDLGEIHYIYTQRVNLGIVRQDENAWWSLAPHDISIINFLLGDKPIRVAAHGQSYLQKGVEDVVFANLVFSGGQTANVHVSWLDPHKIRKITVVGSSRMVTLDDMEATEKIRIYDKSATVRPKYVGYAQAITIRSGDIHIPKIDATEPLRAEAQHFVDAVLDDSPVRSDGEDGLGVVRVLEAGAESLKSGGQPVELKP